MTTANVHRRPLRKVLALALWAMVGLHAVLLIAVRSSPVTASRFCTAATAVVGALCLIWRATRLLPQYRPIWLWSSGGFVLWATAHAVESFMHGSAAASNLAVDPSDFIYVTAAFPLLIGLSTTRETESVRSIFFLNCAQVILAVVLTYYLLYRMARPAEAAATVMGRIYGVDCALLGLLAVLRLLAWTTAEERRSLHAVCLFLWTYLPIELGMDYATQRFNLHSGKLPDLLWSVPFVATGWMALGAPADDEAHPSRTLERGRLLVETLCPLLITAGVFVLAASITRQYAALGLSSMFVLLVIMGLQNGMLQLNYLVGQRRLLEQEQDLRSANAALEELSQLDPLTSVANRRRFDAALSEAWRRGERDQSVLALLIVDVDFFKGANDLHGHTYGDQCIVAVARILDEQTRHPHDLLARYGGDEFLLLLPDTDAHGATAVAKRVHAAIERLGLENRASPIEGRLTVSIGVGVAGADGSVGPDRLLEITDRALYEAKHQGRNRTCVQES